MHDGIPIGKRPLGITDKGLIDPNFPLLVRRTSSFILFHSEHLSHHSLPSHGWQHTPFPISSCSPPNKPRSGKKVTGLDRPAHQVSPPVSQSSHAIFARNLYGPIRLREAPSCSASPSPLDVRPGMASSRAETASGNRSLTRFLRRAVGHFARVRPWVPGDIQLKPEPFAHPS